MNEANHWETRVEALWDSIDSHEPDEFVRQMERLARELPPQDPRALFERASAWDSTGHSDQAVPLYREALDRGLSGGRRRRATIQLASSLCNLGKADESAALLAAEKERTSDELDDAVVAFYALALADLAREREGVSLTLRALAAHLPRYGRSLTQYARDLLE